MMHMKKSNIRGDRISGKEPSNRVIARLPKRNPKLKNKSAGHWKTFGKPTRKPTPKMTKIMVATAKLGFSTSG
jgi:hypothetical protein